jgi:colicin import membrane protein
MTPQLFINDSRGENSNIFKMITLSLIIHLIVASTAIIAIPSASRHITFGQAYSVQLVGPEVMNSANDSSAPSGAMQPNEATQHIIMKKDVSGFTSTPVKKEETGKPAIEKALSALRQKEGPIPQATPSTQPPVATTAPATGNLPQAPARSRLNEYYGFIQSRVKGNWILPPSLRPKDNVVTIIEVKILSNGAVERLNFEKRSGNRYVDDSAMKAVQKSIPFPPFPEGMMENYIEIGLRFPSSDLR